MTIFMMEDKNNGGKKIVKKKKKHIFERWAWGTRLYGIGVCKVCGQQYCLGAQESCPGKKG